ncbi:Microfibrillar-associated protein 1 [Melipona quadrifasciata]|uniref:Microfibrillar-associated protein 1 n=1 Tax=Melipona quadrifasciata TaxID=166423 RepID=A0A0M8ZVD9_9HYME|nr:Microfibrillar-associated protein 1 [Melipona quadrifasciata]
MMMDYFVTNNSLAPAPMGIQSTAGAVPVKNDKGELSMKKVKVHRYVSGKRPDYAPAASSEEESEEEDFLEKRVHKNYEENEVSTDIPTHSQVKISDEDDPRIRRLIRLEKQKECNTEIRGERHRHIHEPELIEIEPESSDSSEDEELSDSEIERRREALKQRVLSKKENEEELIHGEEDERSADTSEESSEYEEYTDSEEETGPRLKPVFVRKKDRITVMEKEKEAMKQKQAEIEAKKLVEERKRQTLRMVEEAIRKEAQVNKNISEHEGKLEDVCTDDENDEVEYEAWKLRELKRIKLERIRNMTEEERRQEARLNPKVITNKAAKGKYKFLQKYYHRGAFYLDKEDNIFKRDFSGATLEDHFDKTILPKVMQVKNFGRSGRTKYTHLVDQDTTQFDSPWISETAQNLKFHNNQAAGMKQVFERPSLKKRKNEN